MASTTGAATKSVGAASGRRLDASSAQPRECLKIERAAQPHRCCILATDCGRKKDKGDTPTPATTTTRLLQGPGEGDSDHFSCKVPVCFVAPATPEFFWQQHHCCDGGHGARRFVQQR